MKTLHFIKLPLPASKALVLMFMVNLYAQSQVGDSTSADSVFKDSAVSKPDTPATSAPDTQLTPIAHKPATDSAHDSDLVSDLPQDSLLWSSSKKPDSLLSRPKPAKDSIKPKPADVQDSSTLKDTAVTGRQDSIEQTPIPAPAKTELRKAIKDKADSASQISKPNKPQTIKAPLPEAQKTIKKKESELPNPSAVKISKKDTAQPRPQNPIKSSGNVKEAKADTTPARFEKARKDSVQSKKSNKEKKDTADNIDSISAVSILPPVKIEKDSLGGKDGADEEDVLSQLKNKISRDVPSLPWKLSIGQIIWSILTFIMGFLVIRYITKVFNLLAENWAAYRIQIKGLLPIFRISSWAIILYIIIGGILHPPFETLLAMTASLGIAVGFASQDIFKNIFGGVVILMDRPFTVGDKIEIGKYYGEVTSIGIRTTRLQTADDSLIAIPNSELMNSSLSNSNSGAHDCQVVAEFYLPLDVDLAKIRAMGIKSAGISRYIYLKKPIAVIFKNEIHQGKSLLKMRLKAYVFDHRYEPAFMSEMTEIFLSQLRQHQIWGAEAN